MHDLGVARQPGPEAAVPLVGFSRVVQPHHGFETFSVGFSFLWRPRKRPDRMCGGRSTLALIASRSPQIVDKRTCFNREVVLVPQGTTQLEVVCDFDIVNQISQHNTKSGHE